RGVARPDRHDRRGGRRGTRRRRRRENPDGHPRPAEFGGVRQTAPAGPSAPPPVPRAAAPTGGGQHFDPAPGRRAAPHLHRPGIVGSSRTFIGEESAGVDAVRVAHARIAARQSDITLVGGGYSAERLDIVLNYELACALLRPPFRSVWDRGPKGGIALGSFGA